MNIITICVFCGKECIGMNWYVYSVFFWRLVLRSGNAIASKTNSCQLESIWCKRRPSGLGDPPKINSKLTPVMRRSVCYLTVLIPSQSFRGALLSFTPLIVCLSHCIVYTLYFAFFLTYPILIFPSIFHNAGRHLRFPITFYSVVSIVFLSTFYMRLSLYALPHSSLSLNPIL